jgi:RNA polymerase sigma-70 factor (ECF subfamily)
MIKRNDPAVDEVAIISRIQAKDESAFQQFFDEYRRMVLSIIYRTLGKRNDNEDIAQQVFANFYFSIGAFDHRCSLLTWIHRLTLNECYSYVRKKRVRKLFYESDLPAEESFDRTRNKAVVDLSPRTDVRVVKRDLLGRLLDSLPDNERTLLLLKEGAGYSLEELSRMTSTSENALKVKLFRVRRKLAKTAERLATRQRLSRAA